MAPTLVQEFPEIINSTRIFSNTHNTFFSSGDKKLYEKGILYVDYSFLDEEIGKFSQKEKQLSRIVLGFTLLAIVIAMLGLLGLAFHTAEQRTKEIAIRKVMGSNTGRISIQLTYEFLKLIVISNLIAWPAAYFIGKRWLQSFEYQADIQFRIFILAACFALIIGLLTVNIQTIRAASANPIKALRYE